MAKLDYAVNPDQDSHTDEGYDPGTFKQRTYHDAVPAFIEGTQTPRDYLERCLETIEAREPVVRAWVSMRIEDARAEADASAERYKAGRPLSLIDGMPIGIKDLISTKDLPTTMGILDNEVHTKVDSASIQALRAAGAIILGKVTTTEMGLSDPAPTTNPFDRRRTPGGSSSGSGAAVGAAMVPATIGSQVGGSLIRPAGYNANFANRPTVGGLHRGERLGYSHAIIGIHAGSLADMWRVTIEIAKRAGGDPGYPGVFGGDDLSPPIFPSRLIVIETEGWKLTDEKTLEGFEMLLDGLRSAGVRILRRKDHPLIEHFEQSIAEAQSIAMGIIAWENRWNFENLAVNLAGKLRPGVLRLLDIGRTLSVEDYRLLLLRRDQARASMAALAPLAAAVLTLSSPGPAPLFEKPENPDNRVPYGTTGSPTFNVGTSILGVPAVTLPLLAVDRMPVGVQVIGQPNQDDHITGIARWIASTLKPVSV